MNRPAYAPVWVGPNAFRKIYRRNSNVQDV